jgi:hypothetical protein
MLRRLAILLGGFLTCGLLVSAQEVPVEFTVSGTGFFTTSTNSNNLHYQTTQTGGVLAGLRFNINRWAAFEGNYGWNRNSQKYFTTGGLLATGIQTNIHQVTGDFVFKIPSSGHAHPYLLAGGGAMIFDPESRAVLVATPNTIIASGARASTRAQGAFVYGGGADFDVTHRAAGKPGVSLRLGYRGYVYGVPNFGLKQLNVGRTLNTAAPEAGLTFRF